MQYSNLMRIKEMDGLEEPSLSLFTFAFGALVKVSKFLLYICNVQDELLGVATYTRHKWGDIKAISIEMCLRRKNKKIYQTTQWTWSKEPFYFSFFFSVDSAHMMQLNSHLWDGCRGKNAFTIYVSGSFVRGQVQGEFLFPLLLEVPLNWPSDL